MHARTKRPADNLKKYKMKHIPNINVIFKPNKWVKTRRNYNETVIFRLYFKVIIRQNEIQLHAKDLYIYFSNLLIIHEPKTKEINV